MERLRRVANLWNWLPPFRVVAEYQSIQRAAVVLNVSASALSRHGGIRRWLTTRG